MKKHKSFDLRDGVDLLEKYVGKQVEIFSSGKKVLHNQISGKLEVQGKNYFVRDGASSTIFWFFNVLWLQETTSMKYKWNEKKMKTIKIEEVEKLIVSLNYDLEGEIRFWQKTSRELENKK